VVGCVPGPTCPPGRGFLRTSVRLPGAPTGLDTTEPPPWRPPAGNPSALVFTPADGDGDVIVFVVEVWVVEVWVVEVWVVEVWVVEVWVVEVWVVVVPVGGFAVPSAMVP
jgi:hypothetical protein